MTGKKRADKPREERVKGKPRVQKTCAVQPGYMARSIMKCDMRAVVTKASEQSNSSRHFPPTEWGELWNSLAQLGAVLMLTMVNNGKDKQLKRLLVSVPQDAVTSPTILPIYGAMAALPWIGDKSQSEVSVDLKSWVEATASMDEESVGEETS